MGARRQAHFGQRSERTWNVPQLPSTDSKGTPPMINTRTFAIVALGLVLSTHALQGQDRSRYRDFQLGGDLSSVSALTKVAVSDAKTHPSAARGDAGAGVAAAVLLFER